MLFHVTATHLPEHCPLYNSELQPAMAEAGKNTEALAKDLNIKVYFSATGAPDHVIYHLVEADGLDPIRRWLAAVPLKQEFRITPVELIGAMLASVEQEWTQASR